MTFLSPLWLLLLVLPLLAAGAYMAALQRREKYAVRFTNLDLLDKVAPEKPGWRRHAPAVALLVGMVALVTAVARPAVAVAIPRPAATVILAVDVSLSMDADDVDPNRLEAAQEAARAFLDLAPEELEVGVVAFAGTAVPLLSPTDDRELARLAIDRLELGEGTAIGEGILASVQMALAEREQRALTGPQVDDGAAEDTEGEAEADDTPAEAIVVLSDGETTVGRPDLEAAQVALDAGIPVSTISFGTADGVVTVQGETIPVPVNEGALEEVAELTDGAFHQAATAGELQSILDNVGATVGLEHEQREITQWFAAAGLLLVLLAATGSLLWFSRMP